jgi:hypothetical protein
MFKINRSRILAVGLVVIVVAIIILEPKEYSVIGKRLQISSDGPIGPGAPAAHYTVVMTDARNLLVTDNVANKLYFYSIDKDKPIGSPLKLRGSVDLGQFGQEEVKFMPHNVKKPSQAVPRRPIPVP